MAGHVLPHRGGHRRAGHPGLLPRRYGKATVFIPYGAEVGKVEGCGTLAKLGLEPGRYFLYVSRMEPENHPLEVRQAFERVATPLKLALVGDAPYARDYIRRVRDTRDPRIVMPGAIYGEGYRELGSHCFAYIHATEVGGTHPALIEAMGRGALVLYRNTPENAEVAGGAGIPFEPDELAAKLRMALEMSEAERAALRAARHGSRARAVFLGSGDGRLREAAARAEIEICLRREPQDLDFRAALDGGLGALQNLARHVVRQVVLAAVLTDFGGYTFQDHGRFPALESHGGPPGVRLTMLA